MIEVQKSLSENDKIRFEEFLSSPYHDKIKNAVKLFAVLRDSVGDFETSVLAKEQIWRKVFQTRDYNNGTLKNLMRELLKLAKKFVLYENLQEAPTSQFKHLHEGLICNASSVNGISK